MCFKLSPAPGCPWGGVLFFTTLEQKTMDTINKDETEGTIDHLRKQVETLTQKLADLEGVKAQQLQGRDERINRLEHRTFEEFITDIIVTKIDQAVDVSDIASEVVYELDSYKVFELISDQLNDAINDALSNASVTLSDAVLLIEVG